MSLRDKIIDIIKRDGHISVADYMALSNQHYYATRDPLGADGDFTTAPEISQIFGELIGAWCADTWHKLGCPAPFALIELGPGRGTLMADLLRVAHKDAAFAAALKIHLVETSPVLKTKQQQALQNYSVAWHDSLDTLPAMPWLLIANEFFDALPIEQYIKTETDWQQRVLRYDKDRFVWDQIPHSKNDYAAAANGTILEQQPVSNNICSTIAQHLKSHAGAALIIDYGYSHAAYGDTLQALKNHQFVDVLSAPGEIDLTAHVNFAALKLAVADQSIYAKPITTQRDFLTALGILQRGTALERNASPEQAADIQSAIHRLTNADQMGTLFKVLAFSYPEIELAGFYD